MPQNGLCDFDRKFGEVIDFLAPGRGLFSLLAKVVNSESTDLSERTYRMWSNDTTDRSSGFRSHTRVKVGFLPRTSLSFEIKINQKSKRILTRCSTDLRLRAPCPNMLEITLC